MSAWRSWALGVVLIVGCGGAVEKEPQTGPAWEDPDGDPYNFHRGVAATLLRTFKYAEAMNTARKLIKLRPGSAEPYTLMARAHIGVRQLDAARGMLDRALALDEEFAPAHAELGVLLDLRGQHRAAEKHHRRAIVLEPDVASHRNNLGFCMYLQGRYREAVYAYRAALERDAGRRRIHNNLGFAYGQLGAMEAAYRHFRRAGRPAQASNNMGYVLETKGELERAYDYYLIALSQDPNLVQARRNLERVCSRLGRPVPPLDVQSPTQQREPLPAPEVGPAPAAPAASMDRQS